MRVRNNNFKISSLTVMNNRFLANNILNTCFRECTMSEAPIVKVEQGELQGRVVISPSGKQFYSFQGIPYAKPPLGSLRFKAPQPAESWEGVRDATAEGNVSAQIDPFIHKLEFIGDENCLFLNVYTPSLDGEFLPVMLFIHGGGFRFGSGNTSFYGGDYLVEKDVVVVTINYRCGPLGFLCLNTPEVPGNAGLKDMIQAIRWVTENIGRFGGNSRNITLFGESCGGVATSILTASPLTKDLISKAVIQSGTGLHSWAFQKNPIENAKNLAKVLGSEAEDIDEILDFLSAVSVREIVNASDKLNPMDLFFDKGQTTFAPVVEKKFVDVEAALTENFVNILTSGRTSNVPIMIGSNTLEFTYNTCKDDLRAFIPESFNLNTNSEEAVEIANSIKKLYFKNGNSSIETLPDYYQLLSDVLVNIDTYRYVKYLVQNSKQPVFFYQFDYVGELNISKKLSDSSGLKRAAHMDELGYIFKNIFQNDMEPTSADLKMREWMLTLWTNFAKTGNPTPEECEDLNVTWLPATGDNFYYLNLGEQLSLATCNDHDKFNFWEDLYNKYYKVWENSISNDDIKNGSLADVSDHIFNDSGANNDVSLSSQKIEENDHVSENNFNNESKINEEVKDNDEEGDRCNITDNHNNEEVAIKVREESHNQEEVIEGTIGKEERDNNTEKNHTIVDDGLNVEKTEKIKVLQSANSDVEDAKETNTLMQGDIEEKEDQTKGQNGGNAKIVQGNGSLRDIIRANDPPVDDLPKNIGVNKFVNFFESLGGKKQ